LPGDDFMKKNKSETSIPSLWNLLKFFWPEVRKHRLIVFGAGTALVGEVLFSILEPWPLKFVLDWVISRDSSTGTSGLQWFDNLSSESWLILAAVAVILFSSLKALSAYFNSVGFALAGNRVITQVRSNFFNHIQSLSLSFHNKSRMGDMLSRVIGDMGLLQEVAVTAAFPLLGSILMIAGMLTTMFIMNWKLALLAIGLTPLFWLNSIRLGRDIRNASRKQRQTESDLSSSAAECISGIKTVQALSLEKNFSEAFTSSNNMSLNEGVKTKRLSAQLEKKVGILLACAQALILWYGAKLVLGGSLTPGDLIVFLAYLKYSFKPMRNFAKYTGRLAKAAAAGERVINIFNQTPEIRDLPDAKPASAFKGNIRFENVSFSYEPEKPVLQGINMDIKAGETIGLVAPSGSGKTTLVSLLLRLYDPTSGIISIDGTNIRTHTLASLRSQINLILQDTILFSGTVSDNITYGAKDSPQNEIEDAAKLANAHEFIMALPEGYDTQLGERGVNLSTGQRQRIAIARAAIRKCPILILDEPTSSLDTKNELEVMQSLKLLAHGKTTFLITHKPDQLKYADRVFNLDQGQLRELSREEVRFLRQDAGPEYDPKLGTNILNSDRLEKERAMFKDSSLPELSILMNPVELSKLVSKYYPAKEFKSGKISYIRYKPGTSCLIAYSLEDRPVPDFYAKVYQSDASGKLGKAEIYLSESPKKNPRGVVCDTRNIALYFFPNDPKLKSLPKIFKPENPDSSLPKFFSKKGVSSPEGIESLKYKPERRFVAKISGKSAFCAALKIYSKEGFEAAYFNSRVFSSKDILKIPRLLSAFPRKSILIFEWINGSPLDFDIRLPGGEKKLQDVGAALAELHSQNPSNLRSILPEEDIERWTEIADSIGHTCPHLLNQAKKVAHQLADQFAAFKYKPCSLHGDFYSDQILIHGNQIAILDLDRSFSGDPAFDLGTFLAHLERKVILGEISSAQRDRYRENFLAGYQKGSNNSDGLTRVDFYTAAGLLRITPENFRTWVSDWQKKTELLLRRSEELLEIPRVPEPSYTKVSECQESLLIGLHRSPRILDLYQAADDPKMPFLKFALDPEFMHSKLKPMLASEGDAKNNQISRIHVSRHKPGRRCLIQFDFKDPENETFQSSSLMGKVKAKKLDSNSFKVQHLLWKTSFSSNAKDHIHVPEPVGQIPEVNMWLYKKVPGVPFTELLDENNSISRARQIATGIYKLHTSGMLNNRFHTFHDELNILKNRLTTLRQESPKWDKRLARILEACARLDTGIPHLNLTGIHRDFYPDQIIVSDDKIYFIDFDLYCIGDRGLDLGNFLGHIKEYALRKHGHPDHFVELEKNFEDQYLSLSKTRSKKSIETYLTLTLARHIFISTLFPDRREFTPELIECTEQRLNISSKVSI
jgi:ATP-binding cassette subfamily B protein